MVILVKISISLENKVSAAINMVMNENINERKSCMDVFPALTLCRCNYKCSEKPHSFFLIDTKAV